jgi:hypothetical protein
MPFLPLACCGEASHAPSWRKPELVKVWVGFKWLSIASSYRHFSTQWTTRELVDLMRDYEILHLTFRNLASYI